MRAALLCLVLCLVPSAASAAIVGRDLRLHDARRGEQLLMLLTAVALGGRSLRRRVVGRISRHSLY